MIDSVENPTWRGTLFLGSGWLLYAGPAGPASGHAHHAVQFVRVLRGSMSLRGDERGGVRCEAAVVPPDTRHASEGYTERVLLLYVDPDSAIGRWMSSDETEPTPSAREWRRRGDGIARLRIDEPGSWADAESLVRRLVPPHPAPSGGRRDRHRAILAALGMLPGLLDRRVSVGLLARATGISESRFSHLFNRQLGTSVQTYVRWLRLGRAARALAQGEPLSRAACVAGFADAAHLTRTFRRMFGLVPSEITRGARWIVAPGP